MTDARYGYPYSHQQQQHYGFYRQNSQPNCYQQQSLQGQGSMNTVSVSLPSSPNHGRFASPHSYMDVDEIKSPTE